MKQATLLHSLAVGSALVLALTACGTGGDDSAGSQDADSGAGETRTVTHLYGETEIPADPRNVVSASVTTAPVMLSLDVPLVASVGTGTSALTDDQGFFAHWAELAHERGVEALPGPEVPVEAIAATGPDLIVGNGFGADAIDEATYEQLSQIAPTIVYGESDTPWLDVTRQYAEALGLDERGGEIATEYETLLEDTSERLSTEHPVAILTATPNGFNVFTPESAQGRLAADLGLTLQEVEIDPDAPKAWGERDDIVELSTERASDLDGATLLFVNIEGQETGDYLEAAPNLESLESWKDERVFTLGPSSFRMDYYSVPLLAERLVEVTAS
ncbi:Fe2+-enterobactin ABC transporter substrate-binding protein [Nocardiopsis protaetiae]|uniref:Fe2+-enterobactin ABC transporter substrate-binding protein n=1 Tax=Nocardiopsis protaetiae TaxID=3382270 RepID=UPI00387B84D7